MSDRRAGVRGIDVDLAVVDEALASAPGVLDGVVVAGPDPGSAYRLDGYVRLDEAVVRQRVAGGSGRDKVAQWRDVFDDVYGNRRRVIADGLDLTGWTSGFTREPMPSGQLREWLASNVELLRSRLPARPRILEIGCATGLVLLELAGECDRYVGVDFSEPGLVELEREVAGRDLPGVELYLADATELPADLTGFDAVVLASVVQYLPDEEHLYRMLSDVLGRVATDGFVFVSDVRSLPLLGTLHVAGEAARTPAEDAGTLLRRAVARADAEDELVIHPAFFTRLARDTGGWAEIEPRSGRHGNELTAYRYDVVLHREASRRTAAPVEWLPWAEGDWTLERLTRDLASGRPPQLALAGIPHHQLSADLDTHARLAERAGLPPPPVPAGDPVLPHELRRIAARAGYRAALSAAAGSPDGTFHAWLTPASGPEPIPRWPDPERLGPRTNDPITRAARRRVLAGVHRFLAGRLPGHLVPDRLAALDAFPTAADGAPDRRALSGLPVTAVFGRPA